MKKLRVLGLAAVVLSVAASGCKKKDVTPPGTVLLEWDPSKSTRASFPKAVIGARTKRDVKMKLEPPAKGGPIELTLALELAPVDFEEDGATVHHTSVVALRAVVAKNEDWTATTRCSGPDYPMGPVGADGKMAAPEAMILQCDFILKYGTDDTYSRSLWLQGDGVLKPEGSPDVKMTLEG